MVAAIVTGGAGAPTAVAPPRVAFVKEEQTHPAAAARRRGRLAAPN
jgi:hypothetical protein